MALVGALLLAQPWPLLDIRNSGPVAADHPRRLAARLAARAPLDPDPWFLAALDAQAKGEADRAEALAGLAVRRNPRRGDIRLWRLGRYLATARIPAALEEAVTLYRVRPEMAPQMSLLLAEASRDPETRRLVAVRLAGTPFILDVMRQGSASGLPSHALIELAARTDLRRLPGGVREAQRAATAPLLEQNRYREAHAAWRALLPRATADSPFDGGFAMPDAAPPFAWSLTSGRAVESIAVPGEGLRVRAFDELPVTAAEQLILLDPGSYILSSRARGSGWRWRISCAGGRVLVEAPVASARSRFAVPAGCDYQRLELRSAGADARTGDGLVVTRVGISRAGS